METRRKQRRHSAGRQANGMALYFNTATGEQITTGEIKDLQKKSGLLRQLRIIGSHVAYIELLQQGTLKKVFEFKRIGR